MADIRSFLFRRHLRSTPTAFIVHAKRGKVRHRGAGISFYFRALNAAISEIPIAEGELSMLFGARTKDFQEISVQATVTYRFADPEVAATRIDFSIDPYHGRWIGKPLEQVGTRITELAQQYAVEYISTVPLTEVLGTGIPKVRAVTSQGLVGDARLAETSVVVIAVRIVSIRPQADVEKALETPVREKVQQQADAASYERRALAVEQERTISENELQSKIELATREQLLVQQEGANAQRRATEEAASALIASKAGAERLGLESASRADSVRVVGKAEAETEKAKLAAYAGVDPSILTAMAFREVAGNLPSIGTLNLTPDVLTQALTQLSTVRPPKA
ncbi:MAG: SPFH domain-containing protein [Pseudolysinimonas sp.]|uniref:SPFH domain-containing protein n=1 Tax=Pseudolysinimonas sp. TaxID=2680009 RepID=UPI003266B5EE